MVTIKQKNKVISEVLSELKEENPIIGLVMALAEREDLKIHYSEENNLEVIRKWEDQL